jgi:hypothetical protein
MRKLHVQVFGNLSEKSEPEVAKNLFAILERLRQWLWRWWHQQFFLRYTLLKNDVNVTNTLYVPAGQRAQLTLQDGTVVWLNATIDVNLSGSFFGKGAKSFTVGEAFF